MSKTMQTKSKEIDMIHGSLWNKILFFALPLAASSILQQLFNSADMAIVGRYASSNALAAVGSNSSFINLLINLFIGLSVGANVLISRTIGQNNDEKANKVAHTSVLVSLISGVIIMLLGVVLTPYILKLMSTPEEVFDLAVLYLRIYFLGMPFIMFYNFGAAILRSKGDTKRPFICLFIGGVINVLLNWLFVVKFDMSVDGVGIATVISNIVSALLLWFILIHEDGAIKINVKKLKIDKTILKEITKIGIPAGVAGMFFSFSNIILQSGINSLGKEVVAASAAALNFELFVWMAVNAFTQACVTFTSQNFGAGNYKRCTRVLLWCLGLSLICAVVMGFCFIYFGGTLIRFYTTEEVVISYALTRIKYVVSFIFFASIQDVLTGTLRGLGSSVAPTVITAVCACGIRILWINTVFKVWHSFEALLLVFPVSWGLASIALVIWYFIVRAKVYPKIKV